MTSGFWSQWLYLFLIGLGYIAHHIFYFVDGTDSGLSMVASSNASDSKLYLISLTSFLVITTTIALGHTSIFDTYCSARHYTEEEMPRKCLRLARNIIP